MIDLAFSLLDAFDARHRSSSENELSRRSSLPIGTTHFGRRIELTARDISNPP